MKLRLIDVFKCCLTDESTAVPYVALSYVWGRQKPYTKRLETGNLKDFYICGSLAGKLPATIGDACLVTRELGYQYLFVDRFCIIQEDEEEMLKYIDSMDLVFGAASLTLVAAAGDTAHDGLPGVSLTPRKGNCKQGINLSETVHLRQLHHGELLEVPSVQSLTSNTKWATRAWTFQEEILSPRLLILTEDQAYWKCPSYSFSEGVSFENRGPALNTRQRLSRLSPEKPAPNFSIEYRALVEDYTTRQISFQQGVLRAFQGLLSALSHLHKPLSFHYALSRPNFSDDLLWGCRHCINLDCDNGSDSHEAHHPHLKKRRVKGWENQFPSWSWLAWQGPVAWGKNVNESSQNDGHFDSYKNTFEHIGSNSTMELCWQTIGQSSRDKSSPVSFSLEAFTSLLSNWQIQQGIWLMALFIPCSLGGGMLMVDTGVLHIPLDEGLGDECESGMCMHEFKWVQHPEFGDAISGCKQEYRAILMTATVMMIVSKLGHVWRREGLAKFRSSKCKFITDNLNIEKMVLC